MGTSQSSAGPGGGVPLVPPWTPPPPSPLSGPPPIDPEGSPDLPEQEGASPGGDLPTAPPARSGRFGGVRRQLNEFAHTGDGRALRRSLSHYVHRGYGGSRMAARRLAGASSTAGVLGDALARVASGSAVAPGSPLDPALLAGRSVHDVMDAVVEAVRPVDGTQDAEAERAAIRDALAELLDRYQQADILNLDDQQRAFVIERFVAADVFRRFELDVGKTIADKAPNATVALTRLKEVRDYVKECVAASFRRLRDAGRSVISNRVSEVVQDALRETMEVFEGYTE